MHCGIQPIEALVQPQRVEYLAALDDGRRLSSDRKLLHFGRGSDQVGIFFHAEQIRGDAADGG
jgi:hypothetical protein